MEQQDDRRVRRPGFTVENIDAVDIRSAVMGDIHGRSP